MPAHKASSAEKLRFADTNSYSPLHTDDGLSSSSAESDEKHDIDSLILKLGTEVAAGLAQLEQEASQRAEDVVKIARLQARSTYAFAIG